MHENTLFYLRLPSTYCVCAENEKHRSRRKSTRFCECAHLQQIPTTSSHIAAATSAFSNFAQAIVCILTKHIQSDDRIRMVEKLKVFFNVRFFFGCRCCACCVCIYIFSKCVYPPFHCDVLSLGIIFGFGLLLLIFLPCFTSTFRCYFSVVVLVIVCSLRSTSLRYLETK